MSSAEREREKWRIRRRQQREEYRVFSPVRPSIQPAQDRMRHTRADWEAVDSQTFQRNNLSFRNSTGGLGLP